GDVDGGSAPSGRAPLILEDFEFDFDVVFPPDLDQGNLIDRFDVLVLEDGAVPLPGRDAGRTLLPEFAATVPDEYRGRLGAFTSATTAPAVLEFIRAGGTVVAIGSSTALAYHAGLPVRDYLVGAGGQPLASEEYYVPGSVLDLRVDGAHPLAAGVGERANVLFSRSPVFGLQGAAAGVTPVGWFDTDAPLRSGWAWGQHHLRDGVSIAEARVGEGQLLLFGPKITFRAQSHGTFPFLFNGIHYGAAREVTLPGGMMAGGG
ncbi:MAG: peptidase, partial [Gammaproteobacteria bacterium]|nr:peptidase [Gammaproteobacteria bacterium]